MNSRSLILFVALIIATTLAHSQRTGGKGYALAGSSLMWLASPGAIFLNPAELARVHQNDFLLSTNRFHSLSSLSATHFQPFLGTFALGIANAGTRTLYSLGYGRRIGESYFAGGAVNVIPEIEGALSVSLGASAHLPDNGKESGIHFGISAINLGANFPRRHGGGSLNAGAAYWILPREVRVQAAWQKTAVEHAALIGAEFRLTDGLYFQAGARSLETFFSGVSYNTSYAQMHLGVGKPGIVFSMNFRMSDPAPALRDKHYELGVAAFDKQDFSQARTHFLTAYEYDEAFANAKLMAQRTFTALDSLVALYMEQGKTFETRNNFLEALRRYTRVIQIDPSHAEAKTSIEKIGPKRNALVQQFIAAGDSLKSRRNIALARQNYTRALDIDPENDMIVERLLQLETSEREAVQQILVRARAFADKNQLDEAQLEYERVLAVEPGNTTARSGLNSVRAKRVALEVEQGKLLYAEGKHFEALILFLDILKRDERNREAQSELIKTREAMQDQVDNLYKIGLQHYVKEDYKSALEFWDKVLLIDPTHNATLEYRKRADEKLKALERLR